MEKRKDEVEDEIYIDPNMQIGLTSYLYKDLPKWAKESLIKQYREEAEKKNHK